MDGFLAFRRTDLALETLSDPVKLPQGITWNEESLEELSVTTVGIVSKEGEAQLGKPCGTYITVSFPDFWESADDETQKKVTSTLQQQLQALLSSPLPRRVLVIGLGNRAITADALGPLVQDKLRVTGHLSTRESDTSRLFAFAPDVMGKTGMEALSLVKGATRACKPDLILIVDSLVAAGVERLGRTLQLADTGLVPGSGIGNHRAALNRETLGVPVIAIGAPLVVSSATLVVDALEEAGTEELSDALVAVLENAKSYFVTPKSSDLAVERLSQVVADAINHTLT